MTDTDPLYKKPLLRLAADATGAGRLPAPQGRATAANPACGDAVTMEVTLADGRITALAHDTRACVLAQASAAILGAGAPGQSPDDLQALADALRQMLQGGPAPAAPFADYAVFDGVMAHPGRHTCVQLPLKALLDALEAAKPG